MVLPFLPFLVVIMMTPFAARDPVLAGSLPDGLRKNHSDYKGRENEALPYSHLGLLLKWHEALAFD